MNISNSNILPPSQSLPLSPKPSTSSSAKMAIAALGMTGSVVALASINHSDKMLNMLNTTQETISSVAQEAIGAWSPNPAVAIGVMAGGFATLQAFSKMSKIPKNLAISALASTCLVAFTKSSVNVSVDVEAVKSAVFSVVLPVLSTVGFFSLVHSTAAERRAEDMKVLIPLAENGNEEAFDLLMRFKESNISYFSDAERERFGILILNSAKKLYASDDVTSKEKAALRIAFVLQHRLCDPQNDSELNSIVDEYLKKNDY